MSLLVSNRRWINSLILKCTNLYSADLKGDTNLYSADPDGDINLYSADTDGDTNQYSADLDGDTNLYSADPDGDTNLYSADPNGDTNLYSADPDGDTNLYTNPVSVEYGSVSVYHGPVCRKWVPVEYRSIFKKIWIRFCRIWIHISVEYGSFFIE